MKPFKAGETPTSQLIMLLIDGQAMSMSLFDAEELAPGGLTSEQRRPIIINAITDIVAEIDRRVPIDPVETPND